VTIQTTEEHYLTGLSALNIPSKEGTGDWHFGDFFKGSFGRSPGPFLLSGIDMPSTNKMFGLTDTDIKKTSARGL
jgi:hypothetical protein